MRVLPGLLASLVLAVACSGAKTPPAEGGGSGAGTGGTTAGSAGGSAAPSTEPTAASGAVSGAPSAAVAKADPIDPAIPETKDMKALPHRQACEKTCPPGIPAGFDLGPDGKPVPIAVFEVVLGRKVMWVLPKNAAVTVFGFLLDGEVSVMADDIKEKQKRAWKLDVFRAAGAGVNIYAKEPTRILVALAATGDTKTVTDAVAKPATWAKRSAPVDTVTFTQRPPLTWGDGAYHARIGFEDAGPSVVLLLMSKNAPVAEHTHAAEWEVLTILGGDGELVRKDGGNVKVSSGSILAIPPGTPHAFRPAGKEPTFAFQMYTPAGPEQRFKKLAEKKP